MKKTLVALTLILMSAPALASPVITMESNSYGCRFLHDWEKILAFARTKDKQAFTAFLNQKLPTGECIELSKGTQISADDKIGRSECIRIRGQTECYWSHPHVWMHTVREDARKHGIPVD